MDFRATYKTPVVHQGPVYVRNGIVIMARLERRGPEFPYKVQVWEINKKEGLDTESDEIVKALWTLTASMLEKHNQNIIESIPDVKSAIMTMTQEMDRRTNDNQFMLAALGNPSIRQTEPKK